MRRQRTSAVRDRASRRRRRWRGRGRRRRLGRRARRRRALLGALGLGVLELLLERQRALLGGEPRGLGVGGALLGVGELLLLLGQLLGRFLLLDQRELERQEEVVL